ncbi:MAG: hypothetical protein N3F66_14945, partial [Spirochaetes bacterium]|nr:hypothetical protein [Spirochaetota bacterium]
MNIHHNLMIHKRCIFLPKISSYLFCNLLFLPAISANAQLTRRWPLGQCADATYCGEAKER